MSTLALFFVLTGTAVAAYVVSSNSQIGPGTVSGHKPPTGKHANVLAGSLNATDLAGGAVTGSKIVKSEGYHRVGQPGEPAFQNGWGNFGFGDATAGFYKDPFGVVHLRGSIEGGGNLTTAFTLPLGYRPSKSLDLPAAGAGPVPAHINIYSNGDVVISPGPGGAFLVGISGLSFRAGS